MKQSTGKEEKLKIIFLFDWVEYVAFFVGRQRGKKMLKNEKYTISMVVSVFTFSRIFFLPFMSSSK